MKLKLLLFFVAAVFGVMGLSDTAQAQSSPTITWETCPEFGPDISNGNLECGQLKVPLDYTKPHGEKISVAVSRLKARNPQLRQGVILLNPGGPSGHGLDMPLWMSDLMPDSVLNRYDLIGFDPRGVGRSTPVSCGLTAEESMEIAPPLMQPGGFYATAALMKRVADGCAETTGHKLPYINTANTARDMNEIRQGLGEARISYFGYSYGTYLGAVYASLFPNTTEKFVLDSATNARAAWRELFRSWGLADTSRFPDFAQFLIDNEAEYDLGGTQQEVRQTYFSLLHQVEQDPITLPDGTVLDGPFFRVLSFAGLYSDSYFADTAEVWRLVKEEEASLKLSTLNKSLTSAKLASFPEIPEDNGGASANAVLCNDSDWPRLVERYRLELWFDNLRFPLFGELGSNIWACAFWHNKPVEKPVTITPQGPLNKILILQNRRDPATPYANGVEMRAALGDRSRLVTVEQGGHGASYGENNDCAKETVTNYFVAGTFPGSDFTCEAEASASTFSVAEQKAMKELHRRMW